MSRGTILSLNFDQPERPLKHWASDAGAVTERGSGSSSGGLLLHVGEEVQTGSWSQSLDTGPLEIDNVEQDLAFLTLSFSLNASLPASVAMRITSYDKDRTPSGSLATELLPAAGGYFQRYAIDLDSAIPRGAGVFDPTAPFVGFSFTIGCAEGWPSSLTHRLKVDYLHYARASLFVRPDGDDANGALSQTDAVRTPQRAMDLATPGDIILLAEGVYGDDHGTRPVIRPGRGGRPHEWITVKNHPGHRAVISTHGRVGIDIQPDAATGDIAYLEFRGLHVVGNGPEAKTLYPSLIGTHDPLVDSRGINVIGDGYEGAMAHHIRISDCSIRHCTSDGIYVDYADWIAIETNEVAENCRTTVGFAPSGISVMHHANFDKVVNVPKFLIAGNRVHGNRLTVFNHPEGETERFAYYNGNGILLDANATDETESYFGHTLVQNNHVFDNGGGGIQCWGSHRLHIVNNTVTMNGQEPTLKWGQIGLEFTRDSLLANNIVVSQPDVPLDTWFNDRPNLSSSTIERKGNFYRGGSKPPTLGSGDKYSPDTEGFPLAVGAALSNATAGVWLPSTPAGDIEGRKRPRDAAPTIGAHQDAPTNTETDQPTEFSMQNLRRDGTPFDAVTVEAVWQKSVPDDGNPHVHRDDLGSPISRLEYGKLNPGGWFIDHIYPKDQGGTDNLANLIPIHWRNNDARAGRYPEFDWQVQHETPERDHEGF